MKIDEEEYIAHYGILRRSGRYPWGSGGNQSKINRSFLDTYDEFRKQGFSDVEFVKAFGLESTTQLRAAKSMAKNQLKQADIAMAQRLRDKGYSNVAAAKRMGVPESSYRALLAPGVKDRADVLTSVSTMLKEEVDSKTYVDVGTHVENHIGVSKEKLNTAISILREQGYQTHTVPIPQIGTGLNTKVKVLVPPGVTQNQTWQHRHDIKPLSAVSKDGGRSFDKVQDPIAINPNRVKVIYKEDGGDKADGVLYVRPGVKKVSLGGSQYAQVRVQVGEGHYLKGVAMYKDDLPSGVDIAFNTSKSRTGNKFDAMKPLTDDPDLPFGAVVRQIVDKPGSPNAQVTSAMNIVHEEGNWSTWSKNLSTQFLSKQPPSLAKSQLDMTFERRKHELDEINALTNPTVRKKLLESYAGDTDSAAVHLEAAALPRQGWHAILPIASIPPTQVYAPRFKNGETVVLIRYPHGGTFEIPELTVNNKHPESKRLLGDAPDVIGIHHTVAQHLSGADFDGDTVIVIPNNPNSSKRVRISPALEGLKNFDPRAEYPSYEGMPKISKLGKQQEMGKISNLITDMTIRGAPHSEIVRAVRHSMVVIDAEKHNLNYRLSAERNGIADLKRKYQGKASSGAATLISRATSPTFILERKPRPQSQGGPVDRKTGEKVFVPTNRTRVTKSGRVIPRRLKSEKLAETTDAHTLVSSPTGTRIEKLYADHSNRLKQLANQARLAAINTPPLKYSASAKSVYHKEVASLNSKLALAERNSPLERQAQIVANSIVRAKKEARPELEGESLKKIRFKALEDARARTGAGKQRIEITDREWESIQAGAISNNKLERILTNTDVKKVRALAAPRRQILMTNNMVSRAKAMASSGATRSEIASALGVSLTTLETSIAVPK